MNLPYADFTPGGAHQEAVEAGGTTLAQSICYEDAYGSANLAPLAHAGLLVNVTNDAWFGHSWARYQHFQIARMRAIEAQRPLLRAANDGVSALVGERGQVLARAGEFQSLVLRGTVQPRRGLPPYARTGDLPVVGASLLAAAVAIWRRRPKTAAAAPAST
jgi:apolipoprotein N-acyltransferase